MDKKYCDAIRECLENKRLEETTRIHEKYSLDTVLAENGILAANSANSKITSSKDLTELSKLASIGYSMVIEGD